MLEEVLSTQVRSFAYPFGRRQDYTEATVKLVQQSGFRCACAAVAGRIMSGAGPYQLPRYAVTAQDGEEFLRWVTGIFRA